MKTYPKMKDSGVEWMGKIPDTWKVFRLKYLADIKTGKKDTEDREIDGMYPFFVRSKNVEKISTYSYEGEAILTAGDGDIGKIFHYIDGKFDFHQRVYKISGFHKILGKFLYYFMIENFHKEVVKLSAKTTVDSLRLPMVLNFPVALGSDEEQRKIIKFLDKKTLKIDTKISKNQKLVKSLKEKKQTLINQTVTKGLDLSVPMKDSCIDGIGNVPEYWDISKIKHNTTKINSGVTPKGGSESYLDNGIPLIRSQNIHFDGLHLDNVAYILSEINEQMKNSQIKDHDILLNITGASIGRCTYIPDNFGDGNVNQHVCIIRTSKKIDYKYLTMFFHTSQIQSLINGIQEGASRQGLTFHTIKNFDLLIPSIEEQKQIVDFLDIVIPKANNLIKKTSSQIKKLREYRESIITSAVTGKIDVREAVA